MADSMRITNFPDSGSPERVAFELLQLVREGGDYFRDEQNLLDTYARCLRATQGRREIT